MRLQKNIFRVILLLAIGIVCMVAVLAISELLVQKQSDRSYSNIEDVPTVKTALLLGTSKYAHSGKENLFYRYRLNAAQELFEQKKAQFILVSGDNGTYDYNEPAYIQEDLIARGIPAERIVLDYAGFRTWDSVIRANQVFLENDFIIVSQRFQNHRALFAAHANNISAYAYNAQDVAVSRSPRVWLRERLARVNVVLDAIIHRQPKFLGETITIE